MSEKKWTLLKGATVLSMDESVGDYAKGDVLLEGDVIRFVGAELRGKALDGVGPGMKTFDVIDCSNNMIIIPGFVDSHRHMWEGLLRNIAPNHHLNDYFRDVLGRLAPSYTPEDVYLANRVSAYGAINAGVTGILDWSHIQNSPAHTWGSLNAHATCGLRTRFAYGTPMNGEAWWDKDSTRVHPMEMLKKLVKMTPALGVDLALAARGPDFSSIETCASEIRAAREMGVPITMHVGCGSHGGFHEKIEPLWQLGVLGPDVTYIHGTTLGARDLDAIMASRGNVSLSVAVEMMMGHGNVPIQECLNRGIPLSLSVDVETTVPGDMFTQMRAFMQEQRRRVNAREFAGGEPNYDDAILRLITAKEVLHIATQGGADANGWGSICGSLTPGKKADLVMLRKDLINVMPVNDPYGAVVQGMDTSNVSDVMCNGVWLKRDGKLVGVDVSKLQGEVEEARVGLMERSGFLR